MKINKQTFANALRESGRLFLQRKTVDLGPIRAMIDPWCERRPPDGLWVRGLLAYAEASAARGDWESAARHFRAAIQFVSACDDEAKMAKKLEIAKERAECRRRELALDK